MLNKRFAYFNILWLFIDNLMISGDENPGSLANLKRSWVRAEKYFYILLHYIYKENLFAIN